MKKLVDLAWVFFWISTVTLGGGMAMLPLMDREFVEKRKYLTEQEMVDIVAVMQSLPGLIAVNMAVLIGYRVKGVAGALVAAFASVLSPFVIIAVIASGLSSLSDSPTLDHIFLGVRAGCAALILMSLVKLVQKVMDGPLAWSLGVIAFVASVVLGVDITFVILFGFLVGVAHVAMNGRMAGILSRGETKQRGAATFLSPQEDRQRRVDSGDRNVAAPASAAAICGRWAFIDPACGCPGKERSK